MMCGITGWVDWKQPLGDQEDVLKKMTAVLGQRGPDARKIWLSPHAAFGHTRLVVVDPEGGQQPMTKTWHKKSYTLVYNGELYNTEEIREALELKGHTFSSHSDTEVLLTAYIEWGEDCLERFNGIFAFAIWDTVKKKLFAARDRLGVKPFFYKEEEGRLLFASEFKALFQHPDVHPVITREGLSEVFGLGPSKTPGHGIYKGIDDLRPAHALTFTENGLKVWRYWQLESGRHTDSETDTIEVIRYLLTDAVERQMGADVPVATFLSGGLDSSLISALAAEYNRKNGLGSLHTYSIEYEGNDQYFKADTFQPDPDRPFIEKVTEAIGSMHHECIIPTETLVDYLKKSITARDMPGYADVDASLLWFCAEIKKQATVALSGECADEIFGGYPWFHNPAVSAKDGFPWMRSTGLRQQLLNDSWQTKVDLAGYSREKYQETLDEVPVLDGEGEIEARRRALFYLNMQWFMTGLLDRKDRMSMGSSLEVRVPFADHRLVQYLWNVPWELKMYNQREKGILRKAMEGFLPDDVLYRKKSPYPKTFHPAYTRAVSKWLQGVIDAPDAPLLELVDKKKVQDLIDSGGDSFKLPWYGQLMKGPQLIAHLAQMNDWLDQYHVKIEST